MLYQIAQAIHSMRFRDAFPPQPGAAPDRRRHGIRSGGTPVRGHPTPVRGIGSERRTADGPFGRRERVSLGEDPAGDVRREVGGAASRVGTRPEPEVPFEAGQLPLDGQPVISRWGMCRGGRHAGTGRYAVPRPGGPRRRPPPGGLAGGRRSKPSPRCYSGSDTRSRRASRSVSQSRPAPTGRTGRRSAFQAVPALLLRERYALSPRFAQRAGPARPPRGELAGGRRSKPSPALLLGRRCVPSVG